MIKGESLLQSVPGPDAADPQAELARRAEALAPPPGSLRETGLSENLLKELVCKHLHDTGVQPVGDLARRLRLSAGVTTEILERLRAEALVEVRGLQGDSQVLRYAITDRGRAFALDAIGRDGYVGPAPVPVELYNRVVEAQTVHAHRITRDGMHAAFADTVIDPDLLDQLGPALHSGKAIFIYGRPGTGKSFIARRLARLLGDPVLVPHAIAVGDTVVKVFDPVIHPVVAEAGPRRFSILREGFDERFVMSHRPWVMTGGELMPEMLEVVYEPATRVHEAPLQVKANNGIYVIDDLGRQRVSTEQLLNRWIVPMEYHRDYFHLANGVRFPVVFDVVLIFSTNLDPTELGDEAFLRRMGHKIRFEPLKPDSYRAIWRQVCDEQGVAYVDDDVRYVIEELHGPGSVPLLACHPRDLVGAAVDEARYLGDGTAIDRAMLDRAWARFQAFRFRQES